MTAIHNTSKQNSHKPYKNYTQVAFQQGKPVLDYELNDAQSVVLQQITSHLQTLEQFCGIETSPSEFAIVPLSFADRGKNDRNISNFGITLGRLPTKFGVIDTTHLKQVGKNDIIAYDYHRLDNLSLTTTKDHAYENYLLKGKITAISADNHISDEHKDFSKAHLDLVPSTKQFTLSHSVNDSVTLNVKTNGAAIVFTNCANSGLNGTLKLITSVSNSNTIQYGGGQIALTVGDEYVIVPRNNFGEIKTTYDAETEFLNTISGQEANPIVITYVQSFIEDIASEEDEEIKLSAIGMETTHRKQLRWCVRTSRAFLSSVDLAKLLFQENNVNVGTHSKYSRELLGAYTPFEQPVDTFLDTFLNTQSELQENGDLKTPLATQVMPISLKIANLEAPELLQSYNNVYQSKGISSQSFFVKNRASVLSIKTLKAVLLQVLQGNTSLSTEDALGSEFDISILQVHSASSKRADNTALINDTLSSYFYAGFVYETPTVANTPMAIPMFNPFKQGILPDFPVIVDGYFYQPPRIFQSQSEISTELLQAKSMTYSLGYMPESDDLITSLMPFAEETNFQPFTFRSIVQRQNSDQQITPIAFETLGQKLAFNDISAIAMLGIGSAFSISNNTIFDGFTTLPTISATGFGGIDVGFSGQLSTTQTDILGLNQYSKNVFGGIVFSNPILSGSVSSIATQINHKDGTDQNLVGYYLPKATIDQDGIETHFVSYNDKKLGYSLYKDEQTLRMREFEDGILQASVFANTFNLRKLAIKTQASLEADLFTLDVPHALDTFRSRSIQSSISQVQYDNANTLLGTNPEYSSVVYNTIQESAFSEIALSYGSSISAYFGVSQFPAIRSFLSNSKIMGNFSSSANPLSNLFSSNINALPSLPFPFWGNTNTLISSSNIGNLSTITVDLDTGTFDDQSVNHQSGSVSLQSTYRAIDRSYIQSNNDLDQLHDTLLDHELGAWAVKRIALDQFHTNTSLDSLQATSTFSNRNTSASLRYHVGDFYPGEVDARGIPRNLLVDTLNLYVKLEPLPLVHWYTMPKHQHSVLEGSLDVSEAIATLLDISHSRGIPDHLFNLGKQFTTKHIDSQNTIVDKAALNVDYFLDKTNTDNLNFATGFDQANDKTSGFISFELSGTDNSQNGYSVVKNIIPSWLGSNFASTLPGYGLSAKTTLNQAEKQDIRNNTASSSLTSYASTTLNAGDIDPMGISLPNQAQPFIHWYHPNMDNIKSKSATIFTSPSFTIPEMQMYAKWGRRSLVIPALVPMSSSNDIAQASFGGLFQSVGGSYSTNVSADGDNDGILTDNAGIPTTDVFDFTSSIGGLNVITRFGGSDLITIDNVQTIDQIFHAASFTDSYTHHSSGLNGKFISTDRQPDGTNTDIAQNEDYYNKFPMTLNTTRLKVQQSLDYMPSQVVDFIKQITQRSGNPRPVYLPASAYFYNNAVTNTDNESTSNNETITDGGLSSSTLNAMTTGMGFHPAINWIGKSFSDIRQTISTSAGFDTLNKKEFDFRSFPTDEDQLIFEPAIRNANQTNHSGITSFKGMLGTEEAWSTPAMRACLSTETVAYLNFMTKTYTFIPGHDSIHPYDDVSYFADSKQTPVWLTTLKSGLDKIPGKGVAKDTDTAYAGSMGTNMHTTGASLFIDDLVFGVNRGTYRDANGNPASDLFELASQKIIQGLASGVELFQAKSVKYTPIINAFSKGSMQTKLLYNCSLRVLHSRPNSSKIGQSTAPRSLTEMFLCVDGENNRLIALPRSTMDKAEYKPYIHVQGISKALNHDYVATSENHPNHKYMQHLDSMISDTLGIGQSFDNATPYISEQVLAYKNAIPLASFVETDPCNCVGEPLRQVTTQDYTTARNGDTFNADPFDFAYDRSIQETLDATNLSGINPMISASSSNSGVEYELLSSLSALHQQASNVGLTATVGKSYNESPYTLQDLIPTANEMTLPGDHEITFVLYTGKHGQMYAEDMLESFNPNVAGCHIKATIEINRPTQYISSTALENVHYGKTLDGQPIETYKIAGATPQILTDMTVVTL
ncbi:hypothetical protein UFOVP755_87 [uncultured Caudovirales phage]|uniref:Uncharacterized protein n=1 Tax=uncultured Caudovirales phage TaxID=2100421 RepID=A0A6J7XE92_9CAUD|nr:hypothetical protein UFOVP755_87 [uncultured Caudovirales phage]